MNAFREAHPELKRPKSAEDTSILDDYFVTGNKSMLMEIQTSKTKQKYVHKNFGDSKIAVIGSGFRLKKLKETHEPNPFHLFPMTVKFTQVVHSILSTIGTNFVGAHIRITDSYEWDPKKLKPSCENHGIKENFDQLFAKLKSNKNISSDDLIYLGSSHPRIKECFNILADSFFRKQDNASNRSAITMSSHRRSPTVIADVLADNSTREGGKVQRLVQRIHLEEDTINLVLDQLILGLGKALITQNMLETSYGIGSSFQNMLRL